MATAIWSWSTSSAASSNAGTNWNNIYSLSGTALENNAIISKVEYSLIARIGDIDKSKIFRLYSIAIQNGPYTGTSYSNSAAASSYSSISAETNGETNTASRPSSNYYKSHSFQNGIAYVWNYNNSRTYCELENCDFENIVSTSAFFNDEIDLRMKFNASLDGTTYIMQISVKVTYSTTSVSAPSNLTIKQNTNGATFTLDWDDSTKTGGSGSIAYGVYDNTAGKYLRHIDNNPVTSSTYTGDIPIYNSTRKYSVIAKYSGVYSDWSDIESIIFYEPSINNPSSLTINQTSGQSCTLSWTAASLNYTEGTITYHIYKNSEEIKTTTSTSYTFNEDIVSKWGTNTVSLTIKAIATSLKNTDSGDPLPSDEIGPVTFTYIPLYKTILYYTGNGPINGYEECIVYYYTGNSNEGNSGWVECEPYLYTGESTATINGWQLCSYT